MTDQIERNSMITYVGDAYFKQPATLDVGYRFVIFNLEHPITTHTEPAEGKVILKAEKSYVRHCFGERTVYANLANNHICDYGEAGVKDTLGALEKENVCYFGLKTADGAEVGQSRLSINGVTVFNLAYCCRSASPITECGELHIQTLDELDYGLISQLSSEGKVVVNIHWGDEQIPRPRVEHVKVGRKLIDAGASLVIGHHSHCIEAFEIYRGRHIFYGLGNFVFDELDEGGYFIRSEGRFAKRYKKPLQKVNQRSLAVSYDPLSGDVKVDRLFYDGITKSVRLDCRDVKASKLFGLVALHPGHYKFSKAVAHAKLIVSAFLRQPRFPRFKDLAYLHSVIRR